MHLDIPLLRDRQLLISGGAGVSGQAIARLALQLGAQLVLSDPNNERLLHPEIQKAIEQGQCIDARPAQAPELLQRYAIDMVVRSPGLPPDLPLFSAALKQGVAVRGELDLAFEILENVRDLLQIQALPVIAITGTDGKSTTTSLLAHLINCATSRTAIACGNLGLPLSCVVLAMMGCEDSVFSAAELEQLKPVNGRQDQIILVIENSSFQLETLQAYRVDLALFLNIAHDHLDRYDSMREYAASKLNLLRHIQRSGLAILSDQFLERCEQSDVLPAGVASRIIDSGQILKNWPDPAALFWGKHKIHASQFALPCRHNWLNLAFALTALAELDARFPLSVSTEALIRGLASYEGLPHRMQIIYADNQLVVVNDSKATTVNACSQALQCYENETLFLFIGGRAKEKDFSSIRQILDRKAFPARVYPYGESGAMIASQLGMRESHARLGLALQHAMRDYQSEPGLQNEPHKKIVWLLSPACASYDEFQNFGQRGDFFAEWVQLNLGYARKRS
ncbi:MAG: hypothetical protein KDK39_18070 [Leptospiraceae bacterium]|nr:hypothetical protein [Leptospiraceae bacterium]